MTIDFDKLRCQILVDEGTTLFDEVEKCYNAGALRACYILTWVMCAESLRQKIVEGAKWDSVAGNINKSIKEKEDKKQSVDLFILDQVHKQGWIDHDEYLKLGSIFGLRSIYAHPYQSGPTENDINHAIRTVIDIVMSKPVRYGRALASKIVGFLFNDPNYLDSDDQNAMREEATELANKLDPSCYTYFIDKMWKECASISKKTEMRAYKQRAITFSKLFLRETGTTFNTEQIWRELLSHYPDIATSVLSNPTLYESLGTKAKTTIVLNMIEKKSYKRLWALQRNGHLNAKQKKNLQTLLKDISLTELANSNLPLDAYFDHCISAFKTQNWYKQEPAAISVDKASYEDFGNLSYEQRILLGRNIFQAANGSENQSQYIIRTLNENDSAIHEDIVLGIFLELFTNDDNQFRVKNVHEAITRVELFNILKQYESRDDLISKAKQIINDCDVKRKAHKSSMDDLIEEMDKFKYLKPIVNVLKDRADDFIKSDDD